MEESENLMEEVNLSDRKSVSDRSNGNSTRIRNLAFVLRTIRCLLLWFGYEVSPNEHVSKAWPPSL
jgi:hypothetical protein